jgi:hypothetical protein
MTHCRSTVGRSLLASREAFSPWKTGTEGHSELVLLELRLEEDLMIEGWQESSGMLAMFINCSRY